MSNEFNNDGREDNGYENYGFNNNANGSGNGQGSDPADYAFKTVLKNGRGIAKSYSSREIFGFSDAAFFKPRILRATEEKCLDSLRFLPR